MEQKAPIGLLVLLIFVLIGIIIAVMDDVFVATKERNDLIMKCYDNNITLDRKYDIVIKNSRIDRYAKTLQER